MLEVKDVIFYYKEEEIRYNYNFSVKESQIVSIMGKSGSGKSTLLDILSGFLEPYSGKALLDGVNFLDKPIEDRPITILFQQYNLFEYLSVEQNIAVGIDDSFKVDKKKNRLIADILERVGLKGFEKRKADKLSGGEKQRVAIARSIIRNKPVLLLDEPFGALDKETKKEMLQLVKKITIEKKLHTIMVTHDEYDSQLIADVKYLLKDGILTKQENI